MVAVVDVVIKVAAISSAVRNPIILFGRKLFMTSVPKQDSGKLFSFYRLNLLSTVL